MSIPSNKTISLHRSITDSSCIRNDSLLYFPIEKEEIIADMYGISKREVLVECCSLGIFPERYTRNYATYSVAQQGVLLSSHIAVIGMGGLGGITLEMLSRIGIGILTCADGDTFEASNLNRQAFSNEKVLGKSKSSIGKERIRTISSITEVHSINAFLDKMGMQQEIIQLQNITNASPISLAIDALGGLTHKPELVEAFHEKNIGVIACAIAGLCGYICYVPVGGTPPTLWLGNSGGIEEKLGNLPQTVAFASAYTVEIAMEVLLGKVTKSKGYIFDLEHGILEHVHF